MHIERKNAGEYAVTDGSRELKLSRGLNRKWTVAPVHGLPGVTPREVHSYGDAKIAAEVILRGEASTSKRHRVTPKPDPVAAKATVALAAGDPDTLRLTLADRLHKLADELLN